MRNLRHRRSLALVGAAVLLSLSACGDGDTGADSPDATPSATQTQTPTDEPTESATDDPTHTAAPGASTVPVYFVATTPQGPRLFREFQQVEGDALTEAALLVDGGGPVDPDYRTLWPSGTVTSASADDSGIEVVLNGDAFTTRPDGMTRRDARLAVQQMVHTLQGVAQSRVPVTFVRESGPQTLFDIDISKPVSRGDWMTLMGMVNVTAPEQGQTVSGDTLDISGVASSFEANVLWEIRQGGTVVLDGFTTAEGWMDKLHPFSDTVDISSLEPGDYTFVAMTDDPSGGEGGGPTEDSKDFTRQ
jgi:hypothetical protein